MDTSGKTGKINVIGEVVETISRNNRRRLKLAGTSCSVELGPDMLIDVHLGDTILIEGTITLQSIKPCYNKKQSDTPSGELSGKISGKEPKG
jgi:hypothetical protein